MKTQTTYLLNDYSYDFYTRVVVDYNKTADPYWKWVKDKLEAEI